MSVRAYWLVITIALISLSLDIQAAGRRTWTSVSGSEIQAKFVKNENGMVYLRKPGGAMLKIKFSGLSEPDRKYIRSREARIKKGSSPARVKAISKPAQKPPPPRKPRPKPTRQKKADPKPPEETRTEQAPLGHRDFYPSDDRPVGFCGDGNACFPGATPVTEFWEGTPFKEKREFRDRRGVKQVDHWDFKDDKSTNIVWKTEMPSWANTQPTVVGDRVFTYAEPYMLVCVDANTGEILWTAEANPWLANKVVADKAEKCHKLFEIWRAIPFFPAMLKKSTVYSQIGPRRWDKIMPPLKDPVIPRLVSELEKLDPGQGWQKHADTTISALEKYIEQLRAANPKEYKKVKSDSRSINALPDAIKKRIEGLSGMKRKEGVTLNPPWGHELGNCMNAPVSDGRHVYASFGMGHTMCVDLNGEVVWLRWFGNEAGNRTPCQSGMLSGNIYIDVHGGSKVLRGLNKKTGETVWEAPTRPAQIGKNKGGYYVGSHKVIRLVNAGKPMDVVVTTLCNIIRASDGKELGHLPWEWKYGPSGGPSIFNVGSIIYKASNGDGGSTPFAAFRLTVTGPDEVKAEKLWDLGQRTSPGYNQQVATPKFLVLTRKDQHNIIDPQTGKSLHKPGRNRQIGKLSNILAGNVFFFADEGNKHSQWNGVLSAWRGRRKDGKALACFQSFDLSDPKSPKPLSRKNLLGGAYYPRQPAKEQFAPELQKLPCFFDAAWGRVNHRLHTDTGIFAQGNRLFIRTTSHLYCIGDPEVEYDWNPASRPKEIAETLK